MWKHVTFKKQIKFIDFEIKTKYLEFGKVSLTNEGILSVKYINKGNQNLERQRQRCIKLFGEI